LTGVLSWGVWPGAEALALSSPAVELIPLSTTQSQSENILLNFDLPCLIASLSAGTWEIGGRKSVILPVLEVVDRWPTWGVFSLLEKVFGIEELLFS
jgi:hypothetical protein